MKKLLAGLMVVIILIMTTSCKNEKAMNGFYKEIQRVSGYGGALPDNYEYTDYASLARAFDTVVFDFDTKDAYLPLIWKDHTFNSIGIPAYVGDGRMGKDGEQEAVTVIAAVLSATLSGVDKSDQNGVDYVQMLNAFSSEREGIILNNPSGSSAGTSMWYLLYPAILYTHTAMLYDNPGSMKHNLLKNIESWYDAYEIMCKKGDADFNYTGFNFDTREPYRNGIWTEPDCAVGIAVLMYYGYEITGEEKYLTAAINLMDYIDSFFGSPLYEILMYYAPVLMARLNALYGTSYSLDKALSRVFDGNSIPRGGWGSIKGKWGDYGMNGLFGSTTDGGGYAFSMNTFAATGAIAPMVRYDPRYARDIGKWILHLSSNGRYFFANRTPSEHQAQIPEMPSGRITEAVPFEGIRKQRDGKVPWFGGDPTVYGWAETNFSLYSGAHIGILGALTEETDVEGILKIDLLRTEMATAPAYPTFLIYNPYSGSREITYRVTGEKPVDLFDTVTNTVIKKGVTNETTLDIPPDGAVVVVEIPQGTEVERKGLNNYADGVYVSSNRSTVSFIRPGNRDVVRGKIKVEIALHGNFDDTVDHAVLIVEDQTIHLENNKAVIDAGSFGEGSKKVTVRVSTTNGLYDEASIRLTFE
ncbi:MAG: hypothetical protein GX144_13475 [Clostridiaceae bacterium]|jgi:hypothetical protein|nr:hypothetical protein [Clostridiaceae bacterium]